MGTSVLSDDVPSRCSCAKSEGRAIWRSTSLAGRHSAMLGTVAARVRSPLTKTMSATSATAVATVITLIDVRKRAGAAAREASVRANPGARAMSASRTSWNSVRRSRSGSPLTGPPLEGFSQAAPCRGHNACAPSRRRCASHRPHPRRSGPDRRRDAGFRAAAPGVS